MQIYVDRAGQRIGPFTIEEINQQLQYGRLLPTDRAWYEGAEGWIAVSALPGIIVATSPTTSAVTYVAVPSVIARRSESLAIWSFVLGLLGFLGTCCGGVFLCIASIICGHIALSHLKSDPGREGRGLAIAGLVLSYVAVAGIVIYIVFFGGLAALSALMEGAKK